MPAEPNEVEALARVLGVETVPEQVKDVYDRVRFGADRAGGGKMSAMQLAMIAVMAGADPRPQAMLRKIHDEKSVAKDTAPTIGKPVMPVPAPASMKDEVI